MSTDLSNGTQSPFALDARQIQFATRLGLASQGRLDIARLLLLGIVVTWLPLLVVTLLEGTAAGSAVTVPFIRDYLPHGRYLLALPFLLLMEPLLQRRTAMAIAHLRSGELVRIQDRDRFEDIVVKVARAAHSRILLSLLFVATYVVAVVFYVTVSEVQVPNWLFTPSAGGQRFSLAGAWNIFVSAPLVRFLYLRAFWQFFVWSWFLMRLSRLDLAVNALHPDCRGGLRFLGSTQLGFLPILAGLGIQLGCVVSLSARYEGTPLQSHQLLFAVFLTASVLSLIAPLCAFSRRLWLSQEGAEDRFGVWGSLAAGQLSEKLGHPSRDDVPSQSCGSEISSMADASSLYDRLIAAKPIPFDLRQTALVVAVAAASIVIPLLTLLPLAEILERLASLLL